MLWIGIHFWYRKSNLDLMVSGIMNQGLGKEVHGQTKIIMGR